MIKRIERRIDYPKQDENFLKQYIENVDTLAKLVVEIFEENPGLLLSPVFRLLCAKQAKLVIDQHNEIKYHLCIDNTGDPLQANGIEAAAVESHQP